MDIHPPNVNLDPLADSAKLHVDVVSKLLIEQHHIRKKLEVEYNAILNNLYPSDEKDGWVRDNKISLTTWNNEIMQVIKYNNGSIKLFLNNPNWQVCKTAIDCEMRKCINGSCLSCQFAIEKVKEKCKKCNHVCIYGENEDCDDCEECDKYNTCNICSPKIALVKYNCDIQDCNEDCLNCHWKYPSNIKQFVTHPNGKIIFPSDASKQSEGWHDYGSGDCMVRMTGGEIPNIIDDLLKSGLHDFHEQVDELGTSIAVFPEILYINVFRPFDNIFHTKINIKTNKLIFASNDAVVKFAATTDKLIIVQVREWSHLYIYDNNTYKII